MTTVGFAICGSFCTFKQVFSEIENLVKSGYDFVPIMSENSYSFDTRFGEATFWQNELKRITKKEIIHTIKDAEPIGPKKLLDALLIAPCTGKTLSKLSYFTDAMSEIYGTVEEKYVTVTEKRFEAGGYEGMRKLIEAGNIPRAVLCGYDNMAYGAIRCLKDFGLRVPEDVAVIGYDDNAESEYMIPSLSSINIKHRECAVAAVDTLIKIILSQPHEDGTVIKAEFKPRESSKI